MNTIYKISGWIPVVCALIVLFPVLSKALQLKQVYPDIKLNRPVHLTNARDGSGSLYVVEQEGVIKVISKKSASSEIFLDIRDRVRSQGNEEGLLSLAFHPDYLQNRIFFVNYTASAPRRSVISRFRAAPRNSNQALVNSEERILEIKQPYGNHNGGQIAFGPDDYLYIGMGDGGSGGDPLGNGQNLKTLLGAILRININRKAASVSYTIPADNPFIKNTGARAEIWAYGLRNPWRFSFDRLTGELYAGDVGQNRFEEINLIQKGMNYGWNTMEGTHCFAPPIRCSQKNLTLPLIEYDHSQGISVTGGVVYRGKHIKSLEGSYLYGDYGSGNIWAFSQKDGRVSQHRLLFQTRINIASFGENETGEVFVVGLEGALYQIVE
ncbi:MAG: PQQ-dependent sugar dehydrogenase [SAR324 cluster bacterium]|nr:PQQ-dependent sugar dehydrogenase [SAR324 cluster bacterium]